MLLLYIFKKIYMEKIPYLCVELLSYTTRTNQEANTALHPQMPRRQKHILL